MDLQKTLNNYEDINVNTFFEEIDFSVTELDNAVSSWGAEEIVCPSCMNTNDKLTCELIDLDEEDVYHLTCEHCESNIEVTMSLDGGEYFFDTESI